MNMNNVSANGPAVALLKAFEKGMTSSYQCSSAEALRFQTEGYATLRALVRPPLLDVLYRYSLARAEAGNMAVDDPICQGTPSAYADPVMEELLFRLIPSISNVSGVSVYPTYSYFRVYHRGDRLARHSDRPACEISLTLNLGYDAPSAWPIFVQTGRGPAQIDLEPGDALLYRGIEREHWREQFEGAHSAQVFLHYVNQNGPHTDRRFDGRESLRRLSHAIDTFGASNPQLVS
jgi:hypothetical protein